MPKSYPKFEANQVLTHQQLNALVDHLENEDRLTRNRMVGVGIACGLDLWSDLASKVIVTRGTGATSEGDLVSFDADATLTHRRRYNDPGDYFKSRGLENLWELVPSPSEPTPDLANISDQPGLLMGRVAIAYVEQLEEDLRNCRENDCDEKGRRKLFTTRVLIADAADADKLALPADTSLVPPARPLEVSIPRPLLTAVNPPSYAKLAAEFGVAIQQGRDRLGPRLQAFIDQLLPVFGTARPPPVLATLDAAINAHKDVAVQYVYDWLRDLWQGYVELSHASSRVRAHCCPDVAFFPRHLLLGDLLDTSVPGYRAPRIPRAPSLRRYPFFPAPQLSGQDEAHDRAALQLERLVLQVEGFRWNRSAHIVITPEGGPAAKLEQRVIAGYYAQTATLPNLRDHWSPERTRLDWQQEISWQQQQPNDATNEYAPFFRVEGHLEHQIGSALSFLDTQRKVQSLPFTVVAVSLDSNVDQAVIDRDCRWADLDSAWTELRALWRCALELEIRFFSNHAGVPNKGIVKGLVVKPQNFTDALHIKVVDTGELFPVKENGTYEVELPEGPWVLQAVSGTKAEGDSFYVEVAPDTATDQPMNLKMTTSKTMSKTFSVPYRALMVNKPVKDYVGELVGAFPVAEAAEKFEALGLLANWGAANKADLVLNVGLPAQLLLLLRATLELVVTDLERVDFTQLEARGDRYLGVASEFERQLVAQKILTLTPSKALLLQHVQAVKAICFLDAARALKAALSSRLEQQKKRLQLPDFLAQHPGLEHLGGVPRGGTLVLAYENGVVKADFALSYSCCDPCGAMLLKAGEALPPPRDISDTLTADTRTRVFTIAEAADPARGLRVRAILTDLGGLATLTFKDATITLKAEEALFAKTSLDFEYLLEEALTGRTAIGKVALTIVGFQPIPRPADITIRTPNARETVLVTPPGAAPTGVKISKVKLVTQGVGAALIRVDGKSIDFKPVAAFGRAKKAELRYQLDAGGRSTAEGKVTIVLEATVRKLTLEDAPASITSLERPLKVLLPLPASPEDLAVTTLGPLPPDLGMLKLLGKRGPVEYTPGPMRRSTELTPEVRVTYDVRTPDGSVTGTGQIVLRFKLTRNPREGVVRGVTDVRPLVPRRGGNG